MQTPILPQWAKQVKRETVSKLYSLHAAGIFDDELADDVAYSMLARAESIIKVTKAHSEGVLECPACTRIINFEAHNIHYIVLCECGWRVTRAELHKTYKGKQLFGGAAMPIIRAAVKTFPARGAYNEKIIWIDSLIHAFHGEINDMLEQTGLAYRPVARNFIEGSNTQVVELIISLAYGDSPDFKKSRDEWIKKLKSSYVPDKVKVEALKEYDA